MMDMIKKVLKITGKIFTLLLIAAVVLVVCIINPWNVPAIFKRNYPEWFAAHPFLDKIISVD
ncbi:MAG: hypothetical protein PUD72_03175 [Oscillospiraceae bacterium]|nr:hypothetical protein [Oscillospiraceae bacterium]